MSEAPPIEVRPADHESHGVRCACCYDGVAVHQVRLGGGPATSVFQVCLDCADALVAGLAENLAAVSAQVRELAGR